MFFQKMTEIANWAPATSGIRQDGVTYPYGDLLMRVERLAGGLQSIGIGRGDPVVLFLPN